MASKIIVDQLQKTGGSTTALTLPTSNASASEFLQNDGAGALSWASAGGGLAGVQVYTSVGSGNTWTKSSRESTLGVTIAKVIVEVQGGGAGGSKDATGTEQIGGSAGGYAKKLLDVSGVTSATITVGAGGAGATATNNPGGDGTDSSWVDSVHTDVKGLKGVGGNTAGTGPAGGLGTGGDINIQGGRGGMYINGQAGSSQFGHGGQNWSIVSNMNDAVGYGAGGGSVETGAGDGGDGGQGIVVVWEYK